MKKFLGATVIGAGVLGVAAAGVAAVGGGAYLMHHSAEAKKQNASPLRLHCRIISGERLLAMDHGKTSDPYVVIKVGHVSIKSTSKAKTLSPVWNEDYDLGVEQLNGSIKIELFDKDLVSDDSLGTAEVDLSSVPHGHPRDFTLQLKNKKNQGSVTIAFWFTGSLDGSEPADGTPLTTVPTFAMQYYPGQYPPPYAQSPYPTAHGYPQ